MDDQNSAEPGGFIPQTGLLSPAPSSTSTRSVAGLPHPRRQSLKPGSNKEDLVRRFVEQTLHNTSRRYVKKFSDPHPGDTVVGFRSFNEVCKELDSVINVLWLSGTPSLQIPFLLRVASDFTQYVRSFPASPRATFELLRKLDHCFASLLSGQDIDTEETLPGFDNGLRSGMTTTDMVRCRSLVEQTRVLMVEILSIGEMDEEDEEEEETQTETETNEVLTGNQTPTPWDPDEEKMHIDAARVYENTIVQLGARLGDALGIDNGPDPSTTCSN